MLAEFGNQRDPTYPDQDTDPKTPGPTRFDGPLHNQIPAPDRTSDNKTIWEPAYDRAHFQSLYFGTGPNDNSVKKWYEKQSSGRYSVDGTVTDWVKVPYNEARYGRSNGFPCAGSICANSYDLMRDALNDYDHDGNFNEPDGYIDHFQIVHAGGDQADGDPYQGEDAIWSHRSKA